MLMRVEEDLLAPGAGGVEIDGRVDAVRPGVRVDTGWPYVWEGAAE
ncbi:hypothetical protein [Streptosporangium sp. NPDC087985]